jgi:hypothetical protein
MRTNSNQKALAPPVTHILNRNLIADTSFRHELDYVLVIAPPSIFQFRTLRTSFAQGVFVSGSAISAVVAPVPGNVLFDLAQQHPAGGFVFGADFEIGSWKLYAANN